MLGLLVVGWAALGATPEATDADAVQAELAQLRERIAQLDDTPDFEEAQQLGIVDVIHKTRLTSRQKRRIAVAIVREARRAEIDPLLVLAVIRIESAYDTYAISSVGARGLMQVMPLTGAELLDRRGERLAIESNLFDDELNVELGTEYLAELIRRFGRIDWALLAYNVGPSAARRILADRVARKAALARYPFKVMKEYSRLRKQQPQPVVLTEAERTVGN